MICDVLIIGGGPAGSTAGSILRKYAPDLDVVIIEAAKFPRDHVGESLLPAISAIINEIGAWDKIESADFPIKVGATYRWGSSDELWKFNFLPEGKLADASRPAPYDGQRTSTAFQVDRSIYDKILLDHARDLGCRVYEEVRAEKINTAGDRIESVDVRAKGSQPFPDTSIQAKYYVDASGGESMTRKAMNVGIDAPTALRNIAIWDYWQNAEWAERIGVGGTRIQVMSLGWGWIWFIPLGPTRTSLGLVTSAEYYRKSGKSTDELYQLAIAEEPRISALVANAERENRLEATKDWSYVAQRICGENWFLAGDACGFADPILSAGVTLATTGGKRVACTILELLKGSTDVAWLKDSYFRLQTDNIRQHIRFADYWYSANARFTALREYCSEIARDAGLNLEAEEAFLWLGNGGFTADLVGLPFSSTFRFGTFKQLIREFSGASSKWNIANNNIFERNAEGAEEGVHPLYGHGEIHRVPCLRRDKLVLPLRLAYKYVWDALGKEKEIDLLVERFSFEAKMDNCHIPLAQMYGYCLEALEIMVMDDWVKASKLEGVPLLNAHALASIGVI